MTLRMLPFVFPNRQWLDVYLRLEQNIKRDIGHLERGIYQVTARAAQAFQCPLKFALSWADFKEVLIYTLLFSQLSVNYML
jgi:hypothetical protein